MLHIDRIIPTTTTLFILLLCFSGAYWLFAQLKEGLSYTDLPFLISLLTGSRYKKKIITFFFFYFCVFVTCLCVTVSFSQIADVSDLLFENLLSMNFGESDNLSSSSLSKKVTCIFFQSNFFIIMMYNLHALPNCVCGTIRDDQMVCNAHSHLYM